MAKEYRVMKAEDGKYVIEEQVNGSGYFAVKECKSIEEAKIKLSVLRDLDE